MRPHLRISPSTRNLSEGANAGPSDGIPMTRSRSPFTAYVNRYTFNVHKIENEQTDRKKREKKRERNTGRIEESRKGGKEKNRGMSGGISSRWRLYSFAPFSLSFCSLVEDVLKSFFSFLFVMMKTPRNYDGNNFFSDTLLSSKLHTPIYASHMQRHQILSIGKKDDVLPEYRWISHFFQVI